MDGLYQLLPKFDIGSSIFRVPKRKKFIADSHLARRWDMMK